MSGLISNFVFERCRDFKVRERQITTLTPYTIPKVIAMICVIDFDRTFFRNDFFQEFFFKKIIDNPIFITRHFLVKGGSVVELKKKLLNDLKIQYDATFLINPQVHNWIISHKDCYQKIVVVSASPDVFLKKMLVTLNLFDEIHGSTSNNLKGVNKLEFITDKWGSEFDYVGDSRDDIPIFKKAKHFYKVKSEGGFNTKVLAYLKLMRPGNWVKNLLIGFPFLLSGNYTMDGFFSVLIGFICFCLLASGGYIINDIRDIDKDRLHARKIQRPLASAIVRVDIAFLLSLGLIASAFILNFQFGFLPFLWLLAYFSLNYFYSIYGKRMRFVDVLILSSFYIIRVMFGSEITGIPLTGWFMATLTFSVLALSINKRYMECTMMGGNKIPGRGYTKDDQTILYGLMFNFATASLVLLNIHAYFVLSISSSYFYFILNLAAAGIVFFYFDYSKNKSEDPVERIVKNKKLLLGLLIFIGLYTYEVIIKSK